MPAPHRGSWFGLPDFGITEALGSRLGRPRTAQGGSNIIGGRAPAQTPSNNVLGTSTDNYTPAPNQSPYIPGVTASPPGTYTPPGNDRDTSGGGGGGGGGRLQELLAKDQSGQLNQNEIDELAKIRDRTTDTNRDALNAALGVFEARKQGVLGRIPGIEQQRDLRIRGLDEGLASFLESSGRQRESLLGQLGERRGDVEEQYTGATRQTRRTAQRLADQLRNKFASRGALDSTQYRDFNIDQSREIAQTIGDIGREKAGKLEAIGREEGDLERYFAEQETQQRRQVELSKDQARAETDQLIQGVLADANLTDAQKVEAVAQANERLASKLSELDQYELELTEKRRQEQQQFALESQKLAQKGFSSGFEEQINKNKAIEAATNTLAILMDEQNGSISPEQASQVYLSFGIDDEEARQLGFSLFGGRREEVQAPELPNLATSPTTVTNSPTPFLDRINPLKSATQPQQNSINQSLDNLRNNPYFR